MSGDNFPKNLHCVPYIRGIPEYAIDVRKKINELKGQDLIIAVDLPHSLEQEVLKAVKNLPRISLIVDPLKRAIPIIPTCASIEAVRSYLEYGVALHFIDTSLPITGKMDDWKRFISLYQEFGAEEVITRAEEYGIDIPRLFHSKTPLEEKHPSYFYHLPGNIGSLNYSNLQSPLISEYIEARQQYMAMRLNALLKENAEILFVCSISHFKNVLNYLDKHQENFDDTFHIPTVTCKILEEDVGKISPEIPYFMYQYEIFRNKEVSREKWMLDLFSDEGRENSVDIKGVINYAIKLALTDGQLYPDMYNMVSAALYCSDNVYARRILKRAKSYPGADRQSNCKISFYFDYDFKPISPQRILIIPSDEHANLSQGTASRPLQKRKRSDIQHFERTPGSKHCEIEFMNYLQSRYLDLKMSEEYETEEFQSGIKDGFDTRITARYQHLNKTFVKQNKVTNKATYVVNYGGIPDWRVFFQTNHLLVGSAKKYPDNKNCWVCFTAFSDLPEPAESLLESIDMTQPLISSMDLALTFSKNVFLFTDRFDERAYFSSKQKNIKVFGLSKIPRKLRETMRCFNVKA